MIPRRFLPVFLLMFAVRARLDALSGSERVTLPKQATLFRQPDSLHLSADRFQARQQRKLRAHAPETMAGGVAVFDYNNDGKLDIFFTNGADIKTAQEELRRNIPTGSLRTTATDTSPTSPRKRAWLELVTTPALPSAITTTMATKIFLSRASTATRSITTMATEPSPMSPRKPG